MFSVLSNIGWDGETFSNDEQIHYVLNISFELWCYFFSKIKHFSEKISTKHKIKLYRSSISILFLSYSCSFVSPKFFSFIQNKEMLFFSFKTKFLILFRSKLNKISGFFFSLGICIMKCKHEQLKVLTLVLN